MDLVLLRHGDTGLNEERRYQGRRDPSLSRRGRERARRAGVHVREGLAGGWHAVAGGPEPRVWTSTRARTIETARLAFPDWAATPDPRLDELDMGELEGLTHREADARFGEEYRRWIRAPEALRPPGGESVGELERRVGEWLEELERERTHVVVGHLGTIHVLAGAALGLPFAATRRIRVDPATWIRVALPGEAEGRSSPPSDPAAGEPPPGRPRPQSRSAGR